MPATLAEEIANLAFDTFSKLPTRCKPRTLPDGRREWIPLSAIVLTRRTDSSGNHEIDAQDVEIVTIATGTKSLPVSALPKCNGLILHDCHAEILVLRAFNHWLMCEMKRALGSDTSSTGWLEFVPKTTSSFDRLREDVDVSFRLREGTEVSLFSTEAPCGDASMELLITSAKAAGQDIEPWEKESSTPLLPPGRGNFTRLGVLRRKPARADAEISMSMSCSDKLMLKQINGLVSFPANLFIRSSEETFLKRVIVPHNAWDLKGYTRAFGEEGRLKSTPTPALLAEQHAKFFEINVLPEGFRDFEFAKDVSNQVQQKSRSSNISTVWIAGNDHQSAGKSNAIIEVLLNGVKQGFKQFDTNDRKGSVLCRRKLLQTAIEISTLLSHHLSSFDVLKPAQGKQVTYSELKLTLCGSRRARNKQTILKGLGGWPPKAYEDEFELLNDEGG